MGVAARVDLGIEGRAVEPGVFVGKLKVAVGTVSVTVFSGNELQAAINNVDRTKHDSLNNILTLNA